MSVADDLPIFYLAAKYDKREKLLPIAALLMMQGHKVQAEWLTGSHNTHSPEDDLKWATKDIEDIDACTHFVLFNLPEGEPEYSSGRHIEFGYALKGKKAVCIVGGSNDPCIFYTKATRYETVAEFLLAYAPKSILK